MRPGYEVAVVEPPIVHAFDRPLGALGVVDAKPVCCLIFPRRPGPMDDVSTPEDFGRFIKAIEKNAQWRGPMSACARQFPHGRAASGGPRAGPAAQRHARRRQLRGHPLGAIYNATRLLSNWMRGSSPEVNSDIARPLTRSLSAGSPGMDLLRNAATMLPNARGLYSAALPREPGWCCRSCGPLGSCWFSPNGELLTALVPPAFGLFAISAVAWVAER